MDDRKIQDEGKAFKEEFSSMISRAGGEIIKATPLGRKTFAREIKKRKTGFYWDFIFDLTEKEIREIPERYRLDERVLRLQAFVYDRPEDPRAVKEEAVSEEKAVTETVKAE
ncbi:MAG: 30S ribosomal protein S6 [bacterium]|nr:30S ribosomal protein S6 [bacterium]